MDKPKRQIGYIKPELRDGIKKESFIDKITPFVEETSGAMVKISHLIHLQNSKSKKIVDWIKNHKKFKWGLMCDEVGMDRGNFQRLLKAEEPTIKVEFIDKIEENLKQYGYK
jgi:hypothetical protein